MAHWVRREYLWSIHGTSGLPRGWRNKQVEVVVLKWKPGFGYNTVQRLPLLAENQKHAYEVAKGAFALWCTVHGVEEGS